MEFIFSLKEIDDVAKKIVNLSASKIWLLKGEMGAGKTTFIKAVVNIMGVKDVASSPTFSIVNEYQNDNQDVFYHFDLYRIHNEEEAYDIGIEEYLDSGHYCFIEWAEKIPNLIPDHYDDITIEIIDEQTRKLTMN